MEERPVISQPAAPGSAIAESAREQAWAEFVVRKREPAVAPEALERLIGQSSDWTRLDEFLIAYVVEPSLAPTVFASSFASTLEMVREGVMEVHQQGAFAPIYVRKRQPADNGVADAGGVAAPPADGKG